MLALSCAIFLGFIRLNRADLTDLVNAGRIGEGCSSNANDCLAEQTADPPTAELLNIVSLISVTTENNACCYTYRSVYDKSEGQTPTQSHLTILPTCPSNFVESMTVNGQSASVSFEDSSICFQGLKIDEGCKDSCDYKLCVTYSAESDCNPGQCPTGEGVYAIKAANQVSYGLLQVPSCECETVSPTADPSTSPTRNPTESPSKSPTRNPTVSPTKNPTVSPTRNPTVSPTRNPTVSPTRNPTASPTKSPTKNPTVSPTRNPTVSPTKNPTVSPTRNPTVSPTKSPTRNPTVSPTKNPTVSPTRNPTVSPTRNPTTSPTRNPTVSPTRNPTVSPSRSPTRNPTPSPTPYCTPIVEVNVNEGCTIANIELWDTNIKFTASKEYTDESVFGTLFETPQLSDGLTESVLEHGCNNEYAEPPPAALAVGMKVQAPVAEPMKPAPTSEYPDLFSVKTEVIAIAVLSVYCVIMSILYFQKTRGAKGKKIMGFEHVDEGEEEANML